MTTTAEKTETIAGYKKTELGWIPEEWYVNSFTKLIKESKSGLSRKLSDKDIGLPVIRSNNLIDNKVDFNDIKYWYVKDDQGADTSNYFLQDGDILLNFINSLSQIGKCAIYLNKLNRDVIYTTNIMCLKLNKDILSSYFLYITETEQYNKFIQSIAKPAVNQASFTNSDYRKFKIPLPPLPEQQKIAQILSCWDKSIEKTENLITAKNQLKKALMQRLLTGKVRFGEFVKSEEYLNGKYYSYPKDWKYLEIRQIAKESSLKNTEDKYLTVLSCTKHKGLVNSLDYFGKQIYSKDLSTYRIVKRYQFAYATNHIEEGSIGYQYLHDEALISPMYTVFKSNKDLVTDEFLYKMLKTEMYRTIFAGSMNASVDRRGSLRWKEFSKIHIAIPSIPEQQKIASVLNACDKEIKLLNNQLDSLKEQKKGLMQKLLTGQIRVKVS